MMKKTIILYAALLSSGTLLAQSQSQSIVSYSDGRITTQQLTAGSSGFDIGITSNAGGIINRINIPGIGDIMHVQSDSYGRSGQSSIRDRAHNSKFNPTQAGFNESLGRKCTIRVGSDFGPFATSGQIVNDKLVVAPFQLALWRADGDYDFTRFEGPISNEPVTGDLLYDDSYSVDGGNSDVDGLAEGSNITHAMEVGSPFTYSGNYENYTSKINGTCAVIRHYLEYRFDREPNHSMEQFRFGNFQSETGIKPILDPSYFVTVNVPNNPLLLTGGYRTTYKDMSHLLNRWSIRMDLAIWSPKWRHVQDKNGVWSKSDREAREIFKEAEADYKQLVILSDQDNINSTTGKALGLYHPNSSINRLSIVGHSNDHSIIDRYYYNRTENAEINDSYKRTTEMSWVGFFHDISAMVNTTALGAGRYETYRQEYYIFYGTPKQIKDGVAALDAHLGNIQNGNIVVMANNTQNDILLDLISSNTDNQLAYPNPATDIINIQVGSLPQDVAIFDITGKKVYFKKSAYGTLIIPTSSIGESGTYIIKTKDKIQTIIINK